MKTPTPKPTRSETVRQRQTQTSMQRQKAVATRVRRTVPSETPPAGEIRKPQRPARRYQAAVMAIPQARQREERARLQAPSLPQVRIGWRLLSGALIVLIAWAIYMLWTAPMFRVSTAAVQGNQRIPPEEINAVLGLNGLPVFLVTPEALQQTLLSAFPDLASVSVHVGLPASVTVVVDERQPVIAWIEYNTLTWVDARGMAFRPRGDAPGLIQVQAAGRPPAVAPDPDAPPASVPFLPDDLVQALQSMAAYIPAGTPILYNPQYGLGWNDGRGWLAYFGVSTDDLALKLRIYETLVGSLTRRGARPVLISVAYPDAPFYRLEP